MEFVWQFSFKFVALSDFLFTKIKSKPKKKDKITFRGQNTFEEAAVAQQYLTIE